MSEPPPVENARRTPLWSRVAAHRFFADALAVSFIVVLVFCYLAPGIKDGASFGPSDLGAGLSYLTNHLFSGPNHNVINGDIITQGVPWNLLDWHLVHHGELPLWNDLSGTGLPQLTNFESAPFALPSLLGYLVPLSASFLITVAAKLLIAGLGTYLCARLLGLRPVSAALSGSSFMLCGAFSGWLGWSISGVFAWSGFILSFVILSYRSHGRVREVAALAVAVAFAIYGGFPEGYALIAGGLGVIIVVWGLVRLASRRGLSRSGVVRVGTGVAFGIGLSAPLWLPGIDVLRDSVRAGNTHATGLPIHYALLSFAQGFDGLPIGKSVFFTSGADYFESAAYLGVIAIVFGLCAVVLCWRRPVVAGLIVSGAGAFGLCYRLASHEPVQRLVTDLGLGSIAVSRSLSFFGFVVALLAGIGLETVLSRSRERSVQLSFIGALGVVTIVIAAMWTRVGEAADSPVCASAGVSKASCEALRRSSLLWPSATIVALCVVAAAVFFFRGHARFEMVLRYGAVALVGAQGAFLLFAGVGINSYAQRPYPNDAAVTALKRNLGDGLLGIDAGNVNCEVLVVEGTCGVRLWQAVGFYPLINVGYGIDELGVHDPAVPQWYFNAWPVPDASQQAKGNLNLFVPDVNSLALARRYGVSDVLVGFAQPAPTGMSYVATIVSMHVAGKPAEGIRLYRVPGSQTFTLSGPDAPRVLRVAHSGDRSYTLAVRAKKGATLVARITDSPGWQVRVDGHTLATSRVDGAFIKAAIPPGTNTITVTYWPDHFTLGIVIAFVSVLGLIGSGGMYVLLARRKRARLGEMRESAPDALVASTGG